MKKVFYSYYLGINDLVDMYVLTFGSNKKNKIKLYV